MMDLSKAAKDPSKAAKDSARAVAKEKQLGRPRRILKRAQRVDIGPEPQYLVPLRGGEELPVTGVLEVRVVRGSIEVWGARLHASAKFHRIVAPPWSSLPCIRALRLQALKGQEELESGDVQEFLKAHQWPVVLCIKLVSCAAEGGDADGLAPLRASLLPAIEQPRLQAHRAWPSLVDRFCETVVSGGERPPVLLVTGPRNVGKSSCCRYLVNALISKVGEVCFLETDLGQPELTTPGLVSLHHIRRPLLQFSQPASDDNKCIASYFAGSVTPAVHPELYTKCVRAAFAAYMELRQRSGRSLPLVVNTHGWNTGLGLELVRAIHGAVRPQLVLRLQPLTDRSAGTWSDWRRLPVEDESAGGPPSKRRRSMLARCGPLAQGLDAAAGVAREDHSSVLVDMQQVPRSSANTMVRGMASTAPDMRWLRFACHFRRDLDPCVPPTSICLRHFFAPLPRVRLCLRRVQFGTIPGALLPSEVEAAFTGLVVALCCVAPEGCSGSEFDKLGEDQPAKTLSEPAIPEGLGPSALSLAGRLAECITVAFVHSFDNECGDVIVYPADAQAPLDRVNAVIRGEITWEPHSVRGQYVTGELQDSIGVSPLQPYCSSWVLEGLAAGARTQSMRRDLRRGNSRW